MCIICFKRPVTHTFVYSSCRHRRVGTGTFYDSSSCLIFATLVYKRTRVDYSYRSGLISKGMVVNGDYFVEMWLDTALSVHGQLPPRRFVPLSRVSVILTASTICRSLLISYVELMRGVEAMKWFVSC
jgi:hypothetical protein